MIGTFKRLERDGWAMEHGWFVNAIGIKIDRWDLVHTDKTGFRTNIPFMAPCKITTCGLHDNILDATTSYTDEEYDEIFDEEVARARQIFLEA